MCEATALHDFTSQDEGELSFRKGETLKILGSLDPNWSRAELNGREGAVPNNYFKLKENKFMASPKTTRQEAEDLLMQKYEGAFLIRYSESAPGDYTLSVKYQGSVQHFKVLRDGAGKYFLWLVKFNSLNELVRYHKTSSVSRGQKIYLKENNDDEQKVMAKFDYTAHEEGELTFTKGDTIIVTKKTDPNWWTGRLEDGKEGMFPVPYVTPI